jgi:O-antigen ligase
MNISPLLIALIAISTTFIIGIDIAYYPFINEDYYFIITSSFLMALFLTPFLFRKNTLSFRLNLLDILVLSNFLLIFIRALFSSNFYFVDQKFLTGLLCIFFYFLIRISLSQPNIQAEGSIIRLLLVSFISLGLFQSVLGVLQLLKILPLSLPEGQVVYGTFYSSGIYSNFLALVFPFALIGSLIFKRGLKVYSIITCLLLLVVVFFSKGRTSWIAIVVSFFLIQGFKNHQFIKSKMAYTKSFLKISLSLIIILLVIASSFSLYYFKKNSADGRVLIWVISLKAFSEKPFLGHGFNSYQYSFNEAKAEFFSTQHIDEERMMLTGTTFNAFNEFIQILVEYGIVGLCFFAAILFFAFKYAIHIKNEPVKLLSLSVLVSFIILSLFSYPLRIVSTQLFLFIGLGLVGSYTDKVIDLQRHVILHSKYVFACSGVILIAITVAYAQVFKASLDWKTGHDLLLIQSDKNGLTYFDKANNKLSWNSNFLYNYGCNLLDNKETDRAIVILEKARLLKNDDAVHYKLGQAWEYQGNVDKTIECYTKASQLIPFSFTYMQSLFSIYKSTNKSLEAEMIANQIVNTRIKIYNPNAIRIKTEALKFINTENISPK